MRGKEACSWFDNPLTCVVLAAGKGSRAYPATLVMPKVLLPVQGIPALRYIIDYWKQFASEFVFVVGYKQEMVREYVASLDIRAEFVEQKELKGIAHAVKLTRHLVTPNFTLVLGDCYCRGEFQFPGSMKQGIGVWPCDEEEMIKQSYSVETSGNRVARVVEKPRRLVNSNCGMGFYFFNSLVFDYIDKTGPSKIRGEIEITDAIQNMIDGGEEVAPVFFEGQYINITRQRDIERILPP